MSVIKNFKKFFQNKFDVIKIDNKKELKELKKVEEQLKKLEKREDDLSRPFFRTGKSMFKFWLIGLFVFFLGYVGFKSLSILYLILISYIISIVMDVVIDFFQSLRINRGFSIAISYVLLILFLLSGFIIITPFLLNQISEIISLSISKISEFQSVLRNNSLVDVIGSSTLLPSYAKEWLLQYFDDPARISKIQIQLQQNISQIINMGTFYVQSVGNVAINFVSGFFNFLFQGLIVLTLSILFSVEKLSVMKFVASLGGEKKYEYIYVKLQKIYKKLGIWLKSRMILSLYIGLSMYLILWILSLFGMNLSNKGSLAIILGLLDIIPYIGPALGAIPAVIAAGLGFGIRGILIMVIIVFLINLIENNVLVPILMNKTLGVSSIVIFVSMIFGGLFMGIVGILLSVPIAVIITLMLEKD